MSSISTSPEETALLRDGFVALATGRDCFRQPEGVAFIGLLEALVGPALVKYSVDPLWFPLEPNEVGSFILTELLTSPAALNRLAIIDNDDPGFVRDPAAYLYTCATDRPRPGKSPGWLWNRAGFHADALDGLSAEVADPRQQHCDPAWVPEHGLTPLRDVVDLTFQTISPRTPAGLRGVVADLVWHLAENPPQRVSYDHGDRCAAGELFPALRPAQIDAVANVTWGGRPTPRETSLAYGFLRDQDFDPKTSPTHFRALRTYQSRMMAA
ncbi:hypothetical protein [Subtercola vilae]|uniref:Uncharacterized protein n=1 Tax=Subtercola vilae TaxID=2056433 RepID=A0A4V4RG17_9MICO|nr:hypothetical protein [Subtercola vilae]TIH33794.1 hypothetical protein D4765_14015 [Subtercola vilae]